MYTETNIQLHRHSVNTSRNKRRKRTNDMHESVTSTRKTLVWVAARLSDELTGGGMSRPIVKYRQTLR